jgi:hypothetical protein
MGALSELLLPMLRERFPGRGLIEGQLPEEPFAVFPGVHPGIRRVAVYDDRVELTVAVDDFTHGHFSDDSAPRADSEQRTVEAVVEFLEALFTDQIVVWGQHSVGGGWYRPDLGGSGSQPGVPEFVWSGPRT